LRERLDILLEWTNPDEVLKTIIKKVKLQKPRILTFVEHPEAPCHNNFAEYLIRTGVLKRKISGGSLSEEGSEAYAVLLSVYVTCKLRGISFPDFMKESLRNYIRTGKPMLLKDYAVSKAMKMAA
jgi:transposase